MKRRRNAIEDLGETERERWWEKSKTSDECLYFVVCVHGFVLC